MPGATLITGASSGIGLETAVYLAQQGLRVVGTMRNLAKRAELDEAARVGGVSIDVIALDVTDSASVESAVSSVVDRYGAIDALINNAGIQLRGFFEDTSDDEFRRVFDTNFFGTLTVTRAVLPYMRKAQRGRVVLMSSIGGRLGSVGLGAYCSSKFALEGFGESLAIEMALYNIDVSIVEPGAIHTKIWTSNLQYAQNARDLESPNRAFFTESEKLAEWAVNSSPIRPLHVAKSVYHAVSAPRPKRRYLVGLRPAAFLFAKRLFPSEFFERIYSSASVSKLKRVSR